MSGNNRLVKPSTLECFLAGLQDQYLNFCKHTAVLFLVKVELILGYCSSQIALITSLMKLTQEILRQCVQSYFED